MGKSLASSQMCQDSVLTFVADALCCPLPCIVLLGDMTLSLSRGGLVIRLDPPFSSAGMTSQMLLSLAPQFLELTVR